MKISYRVGDEWDMTYKKLYTFITNYQKDWKDLAKHLEDIPKGFISYLNLQESEEGRKKNLQENASILEQYENIRKKDLKTYRGISGTGGVYAVQNGKQIYVPIEWSGYGFMINSVYD